MLNATQALEMYNEAIVRNADIVKQVADRIIAARARYELIEKVVYVPWWFVGILHHREASGDFKTYLGNGQSLDKVTTIVPKGRGPFRSFEAGAIDALQLDKLAWVSDWSIGNALMQMEKFNGLGYRKRGMNSPYVWSYTQWYEQGKYVVDGKFSASTVDKQIGGAAIMKVLGIDV